MDLKSKLPEVGTTIFTVMSRMAAEHGAINLSQGYPDFPVPAALLEKLNEYAQRGENQYPPMHGVPYLREQIAAKLKRCYQIQADAETELTVTSGATEALFVAIQAVVSDGDEVIVFDPAYDSYEPAVALAGGRTIHIPLNAGDFSIDWDRVRDVVTEKTRLIIINSPHNPTGAVISGEDLEELANIIEGTRTLILSDEVYEHMVFDDGQHHTIASHPQLRTQSFVVSSFGKTYHATGWKVGYCLASPELTVEFRKVHQFVTFTTHTPTQWAIADYLEHHPEHDQELPSFYQAKRDLFLKEMQGIGFDMVASNGTYFQLAAYGNVSTADDMTFVTELTQKAGVAAIPVSVFYETPPEQRLVRFCFAKSDETLVEAAAKLRSYFS